ncbi:MAG: hypothetical protein ACJBCI_04890 [Candidatus Tisiphia sp.]|nr:MAG: hypothetical protein LF884_02950 [Rickettsia endosymbiont of Cimex lectularius]
MHFSDILASFGRPLNNSGIKNVLWEQSSGSMNKLPAEVEFAKDIYFLL